MPPKPSQWSIEQWDRAGYWCGAVVWGLGALISGAFAFCMLWFGAVVLGTWFICRDRP